MNTLSPELKKCLIEHCKEQYDRLFEFHECDGCFFYDRDKDYCEIEDPHSWEVENVSTG